ncbi:tyrosine phosphatase family-domain-containing protein [Calycina marina]|uniref:Tyrosine phosphatase family-domain-containing protein n=1 Tax=Calycina marina TaxID=1763456 RepID=A0A9P7Z3N2_9HELO|nr:tyrosine phosphatase family-domain-containing protein [Calycina marina]
MSATIEVRLPPPPLPSPPFIEVNGIHNFRDLGGYPVASSGKSVKRGIIFRCAEPTLVTSDGISTMQSLGITHCYDLRSSTEIQRNIDAGRGGVKEWEGCERVFVPVFRDQDYSPEKLAVRFKDYFDGVEGFSRAYTSILENGAPSSYRTILLHIAHQPEKPLVVHCTAGKDRTGVMCALLLSFCGVEDEVVAQEYALTEVGLPIQWKESMVKHLLADPRLQNNMAGAMNMIGAKSEAMMATLKIIREQFGGPKEYMIANCGLTKEEVEKIKEHLIVDK